MYTDTNRDFPRDRTKALMLFLLVGLIYLPFLANPLVFDDKPFFYGVLVHADNAFNFNLRWFPYTSLGVTSVFFSEYSPIFRVQNIFLHCINVLLLLLLLRLWISVFVNDSGISKMADWGAWLGALVFACHPLAVYGVGYLVQRSILMATLFTLVMQLAYLRGLLENNKGYLVLAVAAYFLAVFSKEHSVMAPAILLPLSWLLRERIKLSFHVLIATWIGFAGVALLTLMSVKGVIGVAYEMDAASLFGQEEMLKGMPTLHFLSVLTQAKLFFKYCLLTLVPNPSWMSIDMRETFILSWRDWKSWLGIIAFIGYGFFALASLLRGGRRGLLGLALLYPWLLYIAEFSTIRVQESFVLYRSYLWLPGFMLLLPLVFWSLSNKKIIVAGVFVVLVLVPSSWNRLWVFADEYRLWNDAVQLLHGETPIGSARIYYARAHASAAVRKWDAAINDYSKSLSIDSSHAQVYMALAYAYYGAKRYRDGIAALDHLIEREPKDSEAYYKKSVMLGLLEDKTAAQINLEKSCDFGGKVACETLHINELRAKYSK